MDKVIYNLTKEVFDSYEKESNARLSFLDRLLTISGVLFGVLVSLYPKQPQSFECRLSFFLGVSLLVLGILMISTGQYRTVYQLQTLQKGLQDETESVLRENRFPKTSFPNQEPSFRSARNWDMYSWYFNHFATNLILARTLSRFCISSTNF